MPFVHIIKEDEFLEFVIRS